MRRLVNLKKIDVAKVNETKDDDKKVAKRKNLDNFELNNLDYDQACELDERGFCKTYWSVLRCLKTREGERERPTGIPSIESLFCL